jgi:hypothetical protein
MNLAETSVNAQIDRAVEPPQLRVEILGKPISIEQEEEWVKQLAYTHPNVELAVFNTRIDEADIEDLQNQVKLMMSSYGDLSAKDQELAQLRTEMALIDGERRQLQDKLLPTGIGTELLAIYPEASAIQWGRIAGLSRSANPQTASTARIEVEWSSPLDEAELTALEYTLTVWFQARLESEVPIEVVISAVPLEP